MHENVTQVIQLLYAVQRYENIATHCIQPNLNDTDVSDLATLYGAHYMLIKYRQSIASRDILKISRYLEAVLQKNAQNTNNESASDSDSEKENNLKKENNNNNLIINGTCNVI